MSSPNEARGRSTSRSSRSVGSHGKYEIAPLGKGAMGTVYLAHDTILERDVALKVMVAQIADDPELKAALRARGQGRREDDPPERGERLRPRRHTDGSPFIVMELLKGQDLHKRCARRRRSPWSGRSTSSCRCSRPRPRPQGRHRPPRHQARQHLHQRRRHGEDHGLRRGAHSRPASR